MVQITSREELEEWLENWPAAWGRVIAARAALRVLPYAFEVFIPEIWVNETGLVLFRAVFIAWAASNFPAYDMVEAADKAANIASDDAQNASGSAAYAPGVASSAAAAVADPIYSIDAVDGAAYLAADATGDFFTIWKNTDYDCDWLFEHGIAPPPGYRLTWKRLWPLDMLPRFGQQWALATARLLALDPTYQVWIDWYNRRIEGHEAAFYIPGDIDRVHDKAILARLADATDEDFWGKGATYVNTTLQRWIDEAREQAAIDYVASGAPLNLGSEAELAARPELLARFAEVEAELAKLKDQLTSLTGTGHGQIGHNQPFGAGSLRDDEIALLNQRVAELEAIVPAIGAALAKLETVVPVAAAVPTQAVEAVAELVVRVPELNPWQRAMQSLEDRISPEVRKGFENAVGASLLSIPYIAYVTLPEAIRAFLHYFYTVWFPILPG